MASKSRSAKVHQAPTRASCGSISPAFWPLSGIIILTTLLCAARSFESASRTLLNFGIHLGTINTSSPGLRMILCLRSVSLHPGSLWSASDGSWWAPKQVTFIRCVSRHWKFQQKRKWTFTIPATVLLSYWFYWFITFTLSVNLQSVCVASKNESSSHFDESSICQNENRLDYWFQNAQGQWRGCRCLYFWLKPSPLAWS